MIEDFKKEFELKLPPQEDVINRNKRISSIYAKYYLDHQDIFKWAGMAAFASNHIGIGLLPYHIKGHVLLDLETSCSSRGWTNDFNLLRHINNRIYDDIIWTHQAYLDGGIKQLSKLMKHDPHYNSMLSGWSALDQAIHAHSSDEDDRNIKIWNANKILLRHEQEMVVQPMFDRFGAIFKRLITLFATLDFAPNHINTSFKYYSSFVFYMYRKQLKLLRETYYIPDLTNFNQRWSWLDSIVIEKWIESEKYNDKLLNSLMGILNCKAC
jgi:hypothetical protein